MTYATKNMPRLQGLKLLDILHYPVNDFYVFTKAAYPGLRAVDVECQGGGGGSGGALLTAAAQASAGGGGGGGGYARSLIWADDLDVTEDFYVGAGGTAGTAVPQVPGGAGQDSYFDTISGEVRGIGGGGGGTQTAQTSPRAGANGGIGGGGVGQFVVQGSNGSNTFANANQIPRAKGGSSYYGGGGDENSNTTGTGGTAGYAYGGGASGAFNCDAIATDRNGGAGAGGIVILWVYV